MATSHTRFVELERITAMPLTQDEQLVLRHLVSGESSEEIAAALDWPLQVVRNCTHTLRTWVLDELGASGRTPSEYLPAPPPVGREAESRLWDGREVAAWVGRWRREKQWR
jgi:hypothetical protein